MDKCESGRKKLSAKIAQLHGIKNKLGIWSGFSQQPGSPYREESESIVHLDFAEVELRVLRSMGLSSPDTEIVAVEIMTWESEGGRCT